MPFVAACPFCPHKLTVPDRAVGACVPCPKCGNYFTVAPSETVPSKTPRHAVVPPSPVPAPAPTPLPAPASAEEQPWWVTTPPQAAAPSAPEPPPAASEPPPPAPAVLPRLPAFEIAEPPPPPEPSSLPPWINAWGVFAFSCAAVAMLLAALSLPRWLSLAFAVLGVLLGLAGAVAPRDEWKIKDALWLALGGGGCALLLFLGLLRPAWLNDRWGRNFVVPEPDGNKLMEVSRNNESEIKELSGGDRVDAAKHAIRQGDLLIRVESAEIKRSAKKEPPMLFVALRIENVGQLHLVTYRGQGGTGPKAVVRDSRGKELPRCDLGVDAEKLGQSKTVTLLPTHEIKDLIAVEAPWSGTAHVEVDLPSAAWGREGVCRFTIPGTFLVRGK